MNDDMTRILQPATKPAPLVRAAVTAILLASASALHASDLAGAGGAIGDTGSDTADTVSEEVVVTGTRIQRPEIEMATPVTSVSGTDITNIGTTNLTDYLQQLPSLIGSLRIRPADQQAPSL